MSSTTIGGGPPGTGSSQVESRLGRGMRTSVRVLMLLIVCAGAISWAGRMVWESYHPLLGAARGLRSADPTRRADAVREVSELGVNSTGEAIRSVLPVLSDPDTGARAAGAEALGL